MIDTPGIGAGHKAGRTDEEIVQSILDESDVICFVVTTDSIQQTEYSFLKLLREHNKPLIILMNVMRDLSKDFEFEDFLDNPAALFAEDGKDSLASQKDWLRKEAVRHYGNDFFDIIPVMLYAAHLSRNPKDTSHKIYGEQLFSSSRVKDFINAIRECLKRDGAIRRSQTLLGSTVGVIEEPLLWLRNEINQYQTQIKILTDVRESVLSKMTDIIVNCEESWRYEIGLVFQETRERIVSFTERHWKASEAEAEERWQKVLKGFDYEERLKNARTTVEKKFKKLTNKTMEEIGLQMQTLADMGTEDVVRFSLWRARISTVGRDVVTAAQYVLSIAGSVLKVWEPIIGNLTIILGAILAERVKQFFKTEEEQRQEIIKQSRRSLDKQLSDKQEEILQREVEAFVKQCNAEKANIYAHFGKLITALTSIQEMLEQSQHPLDEAKDSLNRAYAKRIIDWSHGRYEPLTRESIERQIIAVERNFGCSMKIDVQSKSESGKSAKELQDILQEHIDIV